MHWHDKAQSLLVSAALLLGFLPKGIQSQSFQVLSPVKLVPSHCDIGRELTLSGIAEHQANHFAAALASFEAAQRVCPEDENTRIDLIQTALDVRNFLKAEAEAEALLQRNPNSEQGQAFLAYSFLMQRKFDRAGRTLQRLLAQNGKNVDALKLMGLTLFFYRDYTLAEKELAAALSIQPEDKNVLYALGRTYQTQNNFQRAIQCFTDLIRRDPSYYRAYDNLALCYEFQGEIAEAEATYRSAEEVATKADPNYDWPYVNHAEMLIRQGDTASALRCADKSVRMHPQSAQSQYILGKALLADDKLFEAEKHLELAIRSDNSFAKAHYQLARTYQKLNESEKAQREFARFKELSQNKQSNEP